MSKAEHTKQSKGTKARVAIVTCSDSRTQESDTSGGFIVDQIRENGHDVVSYDLIRDDAALLVATIQKAIEAKSDLILVNGGTGISKRDNAFEALSQMIETPLPGFGEHFRMLSYKEIGAASMLSRAQAGLIGRTAVFSMPGSTSAVHLAMTELIMPEIEHIVAQLRK